MRLRRPPPVHLPAIACLGALLLSAPSCSRNTDAVLERDKVASVVIGRSSRDDVLAALGQPSRTERSASKEAWVYAGKTDAGTGNTVLQGTAAASGVIGAFVPYVGLVGSGLGLANVAFGGDRRAEATSLAVEFGPNGVVSDCVFSAIAPSVPPPAPATSIHCGQSPENAARPR